MTIIQGNHSQPSADPASVPASLDNPNHSFRYLSVDPEAPDADALLPSDQPDLIIQALKDLADQMFAESTAADPSKIPPVYTYWGQFIDHDITAGTDRPSNTDFQMLSVDILDATFAPQAHKDVIDGIVNLRFPELDLDSVYGGEHGANSVGVPAEGIYEADKLHLRVGENEVVAGFSAPPAGLSAIENKRDLPRRQLGEPGVKSSQAGQARIGDGRNDENLMVAQFHTAMLHFHNRVVDTLALTPELASDPLFTGLGSFGRARQVVRWTYQWLVVNDYLMTVADQDIVNQLVASDSTFFGDELKFMPLEFSVAGFRFGHTMVREEYDLNMNFTFNDNSPKIEPATFAKIFNFTHDGGLGVEHGQSPNTRLPAECVIDWTRFTDKSSPDKRQYARKIDTNLALPLQNMVNVPAEVLAINKSLARRNLLRGYLLSIPTGQHLARFFGVDPIEDVAPYGKSAVGTVLTASGLDQRTPLWYYILREAEVQADGQHLGAVGSHLVAGTIISMLKSDPNSYINKGWDPSHATAMKQSDGQPITGIMDLFRFAGVAPQAATQASK